MKIGISMCLLGHKVRYDGQHKLDRFLRDELGNFVEWVSVCPEMECGLPIPREAMRLVGDDPEAPRLLTNKNFIDMTEKMESFVKVRLEELAKEDLRGFVFKSKSPTSGMRGVKIYTEAGMPSRRGSGIFAREFMKRFPKIPVEDEGRLHDAGIRDNFIEKIYVFDRWQKFVVGEQTPTNQVIVKKLDGQKPDFRSMALSIAIERVSAATLMRGIWP